MPTKQQQLETIARERLNIRTLKTRKSDRLDFHELAVWSIAEALDAAYDAGKQAAGGSTLEEQICESFTPHAVALIAAKLQPGYATANTVKSRDALDAERGSEYLRSTLIEMLGHEQFNELCDELEL